ncbi:MAG: CDP-alcohol phosphatidyltransferase family protein [Mycobacteriales bacterium]
MIEPAPARQQAGLLNAANAVTGLRFVLVPVFVALLLVSGGDETRWRLAAAAAFGITSLTDRLDGQLARSRGLVTDFGQIADPVADKALTGAALVTLSWLGELAWWVTALVLVREVGVTLLRLTVIRHGIIPASRGGKVKTVLQGVAVALYVLPLSGWAGTGRAYVMAAAVIVTVATGVDYVLRAVRLRRTSPRAEMKRRRAAEAAADESV